MKSYLKLLIYGILLLKSTNAWSQVFNSGTIDNREYQLKTAFIYKFTKYIDWAEKQAKSDTFYIGILGQSPIINDLRALAKKETIKGKPVIIHRYNRNDDFRTKLSTPNIKCHILYVPKGIVFDSPQKIEQLAKKNILIIGEENDFIEKGNGLINFVIRRNKLQFEMNQNAIVNCGFKVSPILLKLARLVNSDSGLLLPWQILFLTNG